MKLRFKMVWDSFVGPKHASNEDRVFLHEDSEYVIFAVFDGVGSAKNSNLAIKVAESYITENHSRYYSDTHFSLEEMVIDLNKSITSHPKAGGTALTTCAICVYVKIEKKLIFVALGDTRIYALGKHYANKLTEDDVIYPGSNVITKCLGIDLANEQISEMVVNNFNDSLLICSDGFYNLFEKTKLDFFDAFFKKTSKAVKNNLHELIVDKNSDDASYILFKNV